MNFFTSNPNRNFYMFFNNIEIKILKHVILLKYWITLFILVILIKNVLYNKFLGQVLNSDNIIFVILEYNLNMRS